MRHFAPVLILMAGCGGGITHAEAADEAAKAMQHVASILGGVKDKATAEAAKPRLQELAKRLGEIAAAVEKLGPSEDVSKTSETMRKGLEALNEAMQAYVERSRDSGRILDEPLGAVSGHVMRLRGMLGG